MVSLVPVANIIHQTSENFSNIILIKEFREEALSGIQKGSKVKIILYNYRQPKYDLIHDEQKGLFANLVYPRPNNLRVIETKINKIKGNQLIVAKLPVEDGTPVLDIQPKD